MGCYHSNLCLESNEERIIGISLKRLLGDKNGRRALLEFLCLNEIFKEFIKDFKDSEYICDVQSLAIELDVAISKHEERTLQNDSDIILSVSSNESISDSRNEFSTVSTKQAFILFALKSYPTFLKSKQYKEWLMTNNKQKMEIFKFDLPTNRLGSYLTSVQKIDYGYASIDREQLEDLLEHSSCWFESVVEMVETITVSVFISTVTKTTMTKINDEEKLSTGSFPFLYINRTLEKNSGYNRSEVVGHDINYTFGEATEQESINKLFDALKNAKAMNIAITCYHKCGQTKKLLVCVKPIFDARGKYKYVVGVVFDMKIGISSSPAAIDSTSGKCLLRNNHQYNNNKLSDLKLAHNILLLIPDIIYG